MDNNAVRMAPHSIQAEEAALGSVLMDPGCLEHVAEIIRPGDFFMEQLQWIFQAMLDMKERGDPIDTLTLLHELQRRDRAPDEHKVVSYLFHLMNVVPTAIHAEGYAKMVRDLAVRRRVLDVASEVAQTAFKEDRDLAEALGIAIDQVEAIRDLRERVTPEASKGEADAAVMCPLPDGVLPDWCWRQGTGLFVDLYTAHALSVSPMTPTIFHQSAALVLGSMAIARRLKAGLDFDDVYPNLFVSWLAPSTLWHKTTSLNVFRKIARLAFPHLLIPQDMTPESLLANMAGKNPTNFMLMSQNEIDEWEKAKDYAAQRALVLDEMSGLMSGAGRDYQAGLIEAFLRFYDCDELFTRITQKDGLITVRNAYVSFIGASTPVAMAPFIANERLWSNGWWARFGLLTPEVERPEYQMPAETSGAARLVTMLQALFERLPAAEHPDTPDARCVRFDDGVLDVWKCYYRAVGYDLVVESLDHRLWPLYGRLHIQALKFSIVMAALDWGASEWNEKAPNTPTVTMDHMIRALQIAEDWRASAHRTLALVNMGDAQRFLQQVLGLIIEAGLKGTTLRSLYRSLHKTPDEVMGAVRQLMMSGEVEEKASYGSRGRPTIYFRRARS